MACVTASGRRGIGRCTWTRVYYGWRPNLPDEGDNQLIELGVAASADFVVTRNLRDASRGELRFPNLTVCDPITFLYEIESWPH